MNKPKAIGTAGETAVVRYCRVDGFPGAERLALHGTLDEGDATLCPGVGVEVKSGKAAETASDLDISRMLAEAEVERLNRRADVMLLVLKRKGKSAANAGQWWCYLPGATFARLGYFGCCKNRFRDTMPAVRITLAEACELLRRAGFGTAL